MKILKKTEKFKSDIYMNEFQKYLQKWSDGKVTYIADDCYVVQKKNNLIVQENSAFPFSFFFNLWFYASNYDLCYLFCNFYWKDNS